MDDFWVFGYGSLMWNPGFSYEMSDEATVYGFHRSLCVRSHVHRGTPERPGLVLGLDAGGSCRGLAFRVRATERERVVEYLRARELVTHVYLERSVSILLRSGHRVAAIGYVVDRGHPQYAGSLSVDEAVHAVRGAVGKSGPNEDYVRNTVQHLRQMRIRDRWLEQVAARLSPHSAPDPHA